MEVTINYNTITITQCASPVDILLSNGAVDNDGVMVFVGGTGS